MMVAHLSDLHLGYRAYGHMEQGRNVREADIARAFHRAIDKVIGLKPAAVLVAGDVFDRPEPPHSALVALAQGLRAIREALPETPVLLAAGARDTPASLGDPGPLAAFDTMAFVEAATGTTRSVYYSQLGLHVTLVPHRAALQGPPSPVAPNHTARWNVLVGYGSTDGGEDAILAVDPSEWDYVALGHEHHCRRIEGTVHYAGSLERVGPTPWDEAAEQKGFLTCELESGRVRFHAIHGRPVVALASIPYEPKRPGRLRERIQEVLDEVPGGIDEKIVRIRIEGLPPESLDLLHGLLPEYRRRALHLEFQLEDRTAGRGTGGMVSRRLASKLLEHLGEPPESLEDWVRLVEACLTATEP